HLFRAGALIGLKRHAEATAIVRRISDEHPDDRSFKRTYLWVLELQGLVDEALPLHRQLLSESAGGMSSIGINVQPDFTTLADRYLERARSTPNDAFIEGAAGQALVQAGRDGEALNAFRRALAKDSRASWARLSLGCQLAQDRPKEALEVLSPLQSDAEFSKKNLNLKACVDLANSVLARGAQ